MNNTTEPAETTDVADTTADVEPRTSEPRTSEPRTSEPRTSEPRTSETEALVRGLYEDLDADRHADAMARIALDAVLHVPGHHPLAGDYVGHDGLATFLIGSAGVAEVDEVVEELLAGPGTAIAVVRVRGEREDGRVLDNPTLHRFRVADGLVREVWFHNLDQHAVDAFWG